MPILTCSDETCKYNREDCCESPGFVKIEFKDETGSAIIECDYEKKE
jgi:hypothetical protein